MEAYMTGRPYVLDLFSGIGGISKAIEPYFRTIAYCECEPRACSTLLSRMQTGDIDTAPIFRDVRLLRREHFRARIAAISAGFPCQDISVAGSGVGLEGERSGLFFEVVRLVSIFRPTFVFLENVPAITVRGLKRIGLEFVKLGYHCRWTLVSAAEVGANHLRKRWFLLAHAASKGLERLEYEVAAWSPKLSPNLVLAKISEEIINRNPRKDDGLPIPVDEIKCFGNSVVPAAVEKAFKKLIGIGA
jgi:DNA (cytosine-5)-methyltransferase 1